MTDLAFSYDAADHDAAAHRAADTSAANKGLVVTGLLGLSWALVASVGYGIWALIFV